MLKMICLITQQNQISDIISDVDTSSFALKTNLANLKTVVHKLDIDKSKNLPNNLNNLTTKVDKLDINTLVPVPVEQCYNVVIE